MGRQVGRRVREVCDEGKAGREKGKKEKEVGNEREGGEQRK